jgi:hypothetical protein
MAASEVETEIRVPQCLILYQKNEVLIGTSLLVSPLPVSR